MLWRFKLQHKDGRMIDFPNPDRPDGLWEGENAPHAKAEKEVTEPGWRLIPTGRAEKAEDIT